MTGMTWHIGYFVRDVMPTAKVKDYFETIKLGKVYTLHSSIEHDELHDGRKIKALDGVAVTKHGLVQMRANSLEGSYKTSVLYFAYEGHLYSRHFDQFLHGRGIARKAKEFANDVVERNYHGKRKKL